MLDCDIPLAPKEDLLNKLVRKVWQFRFNTMSRDKLAKIMLEAEEDIQRSAIAGNPTAMYLMGRKYEFGPCKNIPLAMEWMLKAKEKGDILCYHSLFMMEED